MVKTTTVPTALKAADHAVAADTYKAPEGCMHRATSLNLRIDLLPNKPAGPLWPPSGNYPHHIAHPDDAALRNVRREAAVAAHGVVAAGPQLFFHA